MTTSKTTTQRFTKNDWYAMAGAEGDAHIVNINPESPIHNCSILKQVVGGEYEVLATIDNLGCNIVFTNKETYKMFQLDKTDGKNSGPKVLEEWKEAWESGSLDFHDLGDYTDMGFKLSCIG